MDTHALKTCYRIVFISLLFQFGSVAGAFAADTPPSSSPSSRKLAPARGHYARLAQLDPQPAEENLPIDTERWKTDPKFIERVEKIEPQFVKRAARNVRFAAMSGKQFPANAGRNGLSAAPAGKPHRGGG